MIPSRGHAIREGLLQNHVVTRIHLSQVHTPSGITAHFRHFAPDEGVQRIIAARQRVALMTASVQRQAEMLA